MVYISGILARNNKKIIKWKFKKGMYKPIKENGYLKPGISNV